MKNKVIIILTLLVTAGIVGNAFANPTDADRYITQGPSSYDSSNSAAIPSGSILNSKEEGIETQTIVGEVVSVNVNKNVFVIADKRDGITKTVSTDAGTIASLKPGQFVTVKLHAGSPVALSVEAGDSLL